MKGRKVGAEAGKGLLLAGFLAIVMLWLSGAFLDKVQPARAAPEGKPPVVKTARVERRAVPVVIEQAGTVAARVEATVTARVIAQILEIPVREGMQVAGGPEGTVLLRLDDRDLAARVRQAASEVEAASRGVETASARFEAAQAAIGGASAALRQAKSEYARTEALRRDKAATARDFEQARAAFDGASAQSRAAERGAEAAAGERAGAEARLEQARAALSEAEVARSFAVIRAPVSGRLTKKFVDPGDTASPGKPLFLIETEGEPELRATVAESLASALTIGGAVTVQVDALKKIFQGVIREVTPRADPATRTVLVKVALPPDPALVSGLYGRLAIPRGTTEALLAPASALSEAGQLTLVEALDASGRPRRRFVTVGDRHDGLIEVLSGLREGEEVVVP